MRRILATIAVAVAVLSGSAAAQRAAEKPAQETLAQKARKLYVNACSAMRTQQWGQARGLFERYLKLYGTHEHVPVAYLNLAWCREGLKDAPGRDEALAEVCRRFGGSPAWETAFVARLEAARKANDHDGYLKLLNDMTRASLAPLRVHGLLSWEFSRYRSANYSFWRAYSGYDLAPLRPGGVYRAPGWVAGVAEMADTPERARKALRALGRNFRTFARELPGDWQYVRVALMRNAEQADQAQAAYDQYVKEWGNDPRAIRLYMTEIQHHTQAERHDKADAAFEAVLKKFPGAGGLADPLRRYLYAAYRAKRYESFSRLAPYFLKDYTASAYWNTFSSYWQAMAMRQFDKKDTNAAGALLKQFDDAYPDRTPGQKRNKALAKMRLLMTLGKVDEAAEEARPLIAQRMWSGYSFTTISSYASRHKPFAALADAARKKWRIPVPDPTSKAFGMLNKLRLRLKDDQVRHAEEIGEQMFAQYRNDASTIEAVKALADYYFAKVLPQPRDKWMTRMIQAYPFHPQTEAVLANRIRADQAAKQYNKLGESLDTMLERFAGGFSSEHYRLRISSYSAAQDAAGAEAFARKFYAEAAKAGHIYAIDEIAARQLADKADDFKAQGDCWMEWARAADGTRAEVHCLVKAWRAYYRTPWARGAAAPLWEQALAVSRQMAKTTADPEVTWVAVFDEVNILSDKGDAAAALAALNKALRGSRRIRGLSYRVDFVSLGGALGKANLPDKGPALARRLKGVCFTGRDRRAIDLMLARMYDAVKDPRAADHYLQAVKAHPFPARMNYHFVAGLRALSRQKAAGRYRAELDAHLRRIGRVQELVPGLMASGGAYYLSNRDPQALTMQRRLTSRYPASDGRDTLDATIQKARERARPR